MKTALKFGSVALGLLTLASCSTDDFFETKKIDGKKELVVSVEAPEANDGVVTRAGFIPGTMGIVWQDGDEFRVYGEALQEYDIYAWDGSAITLIGDEDVEEHKYAIFPGKQVTHAGWSKEHKSVTALVNIPTSVVYGNSTVSNGTVAYMSNLPLWGTVAEEGNNLKTSLKHLGAYTDIALYTGAGVDAIRIVAAKKDVALSSLTGSTSTLNDDDLDETTPLSGPFDALLQDNGYLVANADASNYKSYIEVTGIPTDGNELHVYIPIIPATYENLVIQYSTDNGSTWTAFENEDAGFTSQYIDKTVTRNMRFTKNLEKGEKAEDALVESLIDLNEKLEVAYTDKDFGAKNVLDVNVAAGKTIETEATFAKIVIPSGTTSGVKYDGKPRNASDVNNTNPIIINIYGAITNGTANVPLTITGGNSGQQVTLNFIGGISGDQRIEVETDCDLVLSGNLESTGTGELYKNINVSKAGTGLTLGQGAVAPFSTNMTVNDAIATVPLTVDAGSGEIAAIVTDASAVTVDGGKIGDITAKTAAVTVNAPAVVSGTITKNDVTGVITIKETTVETVKLGKASVEIRLDGGTGKEAKTAKIATLNVNNQNTPVVKSQGKAVIGTVSGAKNATNAPIYQSAWNDDNIATDDITGGNIYTAAQLGGVKSGNYVLQANIYFGKKFGADWTIDNTAANGAKGTDLETVSGLKWKSLDFSGSFMGNGEQAAPHKYLSTIDGLNAPLFAKVSGTTTIGGKNKALALTNVDIASDKENQGALAQTVEGTTTISYVTASGTVGAATGTVASKNIGGLVGKAAGVVSLLNVSVGTSTVRGYANVGGFIGNFAGSEFTVQINDDKGPDDVKSTVIFNKTADYTGEGSDDNCGTFGAFIGSITGNGAKVIVKTGKKGSDVVGNKFEHFFNTIDTDALDFDAHTKQNQDQEDSKTYQFKGMDNHEFGYSTATSLHAESTMYGEINDYGVPVPLTIDKINIWEEKQ